MRRKILKKRFGRLAAGTRLMHDDEVFVKVEGEWFEVDHDYIHRNAVRLLNGQMFTFSEDEFVELA